jgi:YrbI family 3-deoxy-D-manno-octulosonate 8-phosphate phosphatase
MTPPAFSAVDLLVFDFDGVFTDNRVLVSQDGIESVFCWRSDGLGLVRVRSLGVQVLILSTETNPVVSARARKLGLDCRQGVGDKADTLRQVCEALRTPLERTLFVGNDINDIGAFKIAGIPVAVADAHPEVDPYVIYRTRALGGRGAVREVCDLVYHARIVGPGGPA